MAAYTLPENAQSIALLRVVVKENFSRDMADMLLKDVLQACKTLSSKPAGPTPPPTKEKHRPIC